MSNFYSNHYLSIPIYKHDSLPIVETGEFDFYRCVPFQDSFYGKTVSELHAGNLRMSNGRYSKLFPGEKVSYWASDSKIARAEVKKHGANNNLLTFFAYDDATASFPTLSKKRNLLRILDGVHFGFLDILLKIENGQTLSRGESNLIQRIREEEPDCLAYESEIDRTKTNYIFFEKGFKKLAIRELRLRLGSEEKISKNMIWCAGTCDYTAYLESYKTTLNVFTAMLYDYMEWNSSHKYKVYGQCREHDGEKILFFSLRDIEVLVPNGKTADGKQKYTKYYPKSFINQYGEDAYQSIYANRAYLLDYFKVWDACIGSVAVDEDEIEERIRKASEELLKPKE